MNPLASKLAARACGDLRYHGAKSTRINGKRYTDTQLAEMVAESYMNHVTELPGVPAGADRKTTRRAVKARREAALKLVRKDMAAQLGVDYTDLIGWGAIGLLFLFAGPLALVIAVLSGVVSWFIRYELE